MKNVLTPGLIRRLIDNTPIAYIILDDTYKIHYINSYFLKLRNLELHSTLGETCYNISNGGKMCDNCAVQQALLTDEKTMISRKDILADGTPRYVDDYAIPLLKTPEREYILEIMVNRSEEMLAHEQREKDYSEILNLFSLLLEAKDLYTAEHSSNVKKYAVNLAHAMGLPMDEINNISVAASLHDLGKVKISDSIINKPGKLTDEEFQSIKSHPVVSYEMLNRLSGFKEMKDIVRSHHERYDGRGYPDALAGEEISLGARVVAVADTYDAMTSTRSYRKALSHETALEEIIRCAGTQFDPDVAQAFISMNFDGESQRSIVLDKKTVERELSEHTAVFGKQPIEDYSSTINEDLLLKKVFENTPCGYILMDTNQEILLANNYFLNYMGLEEDEVVGYICYKAGGIGQSPCPNCPVLRSLKSKKIESKRQEQVIKGALKIFDMFAIPLLDEESGKIEYVVEVIIDRTREVLLMREREKDFKKLVDLMRDIYYEQFPGAIGQKMKDEIVNLRKSIYDLIMKQADTFHE